MHKLAAEITSFITENCETIILRNPDDFPKSPFIYLFLPEKNLVLHCIDQEIMVDKSTFFQELTNQFAAQNIKIIHLWVDVWHAKQDIVKSRLLSVLGKSETIPARLTQVRRIDKVLLDNFLTINHLQGSVNAKLKYALFLPKRYFRVIKNEKIVSELKDSEEMLVAVASFSNSKKILREGNVFRSFELIRFANLKGFTVVGGLNKLLKNFIREQSPDDIMTYADCDWSDGTNYEKLGFERIIQTSPLSFEVDNQLFTRKLIDQNSEKNKIYNAGNWKFLMKINHE
ncbi:hypothetical protein EMA8858_00123 [Emticicia aquatica]|uniref:GNAT family N-acetyltransferase n=1 Tax=Emticicia aquatica TaxID=1681835 RepID=A0ABM9AKJ8_9BACT|nr:hypothetical protein [Emticicia aquatica]CAH0994016.1 hypothetical protein EMA8858_00123 [Emticicia aquatica]